MSVKIFYGLAGRILATLINVTYISQFLRSDGGYVVLKNREKLSVSKAKKGMLMERLGLK
jgi:two-component system LytT family response regulator